MITILKYGKISHTMRCPKCGCEFTYEFADMQIDEKNKLIFVLCPGCNYECPHELRVKVSDTDKINIPNVPFIPVSHNLDSSIPDDCKYCANYPFKIGQTPIVGDTPCTWCSKYRVT